MRALNSKNKLYKSIVSVVLVTILTACSNDQQVSSVTEPPIVVYGKQCEALIGKIPAFDCNDGIDVPITVDGKEPNSYEPRMTCDRPAMLPYGEETFGQCTPYSKVLDLSQGGTQISAFCRREYLRDQQSPYYDEVDIILHSVETGDTCWFHAESTAGNSAGFKASRVPPPSELTPPKGEVSAADFWWTPEQTATKNCSSCHDADPFMYSAYIGQVWQHVPVDPLGFYNSQIGDAFNDWPALESMSTEGNTCVGCHRIGNKNSCDKDIIASAAGLKHIDGGNQAANSYPLKNWMPVNNFHSEAFWNEVYLQSALDLISCCDDPSQAMCKFKPITGKPKSTAQVN